MQGFLHEYGGKGKCCNLGVMGSCPTEFRGHGGMSHRIQDLCSGILGREGSSYSTFNECPASVILHGMFSS